MKRITLSLLLLAAILALAGQGRADSLDQVAMSTTTPNVVEISGTFADSCERSPILLTTTLEDKVIVQIFTMPAPAEDACLTGGATPFALSTEITPPDDSFDLVTLLYQGTPRANDEVSLVASMVVSVDGNDSEPPESLEVSVNITPTTINLKRQGQPINAKIELGEGHDPAEVDPASITLNLAENADPAAAIPAERVNVTDEGLNIKFPGSEVLDLLSTAADRFPATITLAVSGAFADGTTFMGTDTVKVNKSGK